MQLRGKRKFLQTTAIMVALSPLTAQQLHAASINVGANAAVDSAVGLFKNTDMNFATLTHGGAGTVSLNFSDGVSNIGGSLNPALCFAKKFLVLWKDVGI